MFSWWHANASKKARDAAEKADANAPRGEAIEKIAEALNLTPADTPSVEWQDEQTFSYATPTAPTVNAITNDPSGTSRGPLPSHFP